MDDTFIDTIRERLVKTRDLNELRAVYHARRRTMTDDERAAISDEMARLRQQLADLEGNDRG